MNCCMHQQIYKNICIDCGFSINDTELISYATHAVLIKNEHLNYKYTVSDKSYFIKEKIKEILVSIHKQEYEDEIYKFITTKTFTKKMNMTDKIIISAYVILKKEGCPVLPNDFYKFCKKGVNYFHKMLFREFNYSRNTEIYKNNVICKIFNFLKNKKIFFDEKDTKVKIHNILNKNDIALNLIDVILFSIFTDENEIMWECTDKNIYRRTVRKLTKKEKHKKKKNSIINDKIKIICKRLNGKIKHYEKIDEIDLFLEKKILQGEDLTNLKNLTSNEIKKMLRKEF